MIHSYTSLNTYDICPRQWQHRFLLKDLPPMTQPTEAMRWGTRVHDAFEKRIAKNVPFEPELARFEKYAANLVGKPVKVEYKLGIDVKGITCSFWGDDVWLRGKLDVFWPAHGAAWIPDWKTGKTREDPFELEIFGVLAKAAHPELEQIVGQYIWLRDDRSGKPHDVSDTKKTLESLQEQVDAIEHQGAMGYYPPKEGPLCSWCPCSKEQCEFKK